MYNQVVTSLIQIRQIITQTEKNQPSYKTCPYGFLAEGGEGE